MYNIDPTSLTVSGFSAGGFMAAQLAIAYSSNFTRGFGVFAGGPYDCARDQDFWTVCMHNGSPDVAPSLKNVARWRNEGKIDAVRNLESNRPRVYVQTGLLDETVGVNVVAALLEQLEGLGVADERVKYVELERAAHVMPTDSDGERLVRCDESLQPYVANCEYDGVGEMLGWLYQDEEFEMTPRRERDRLEGHLLRYAQKGDLGAIGLAEYGYQYIPASCTVEGSDPRDDQHFAATRSPACKVHIALHGCTMSYLDIGDTWIRDAGYLEWADTNGLVVIFPQAGHDETQRPIWYGKGTKYPGAVLSCFDLVGWTGEDADWKSGKQMRAIMNAVETLVSKSQQLEKQAASEDRIEL